MVLLVVQLAPLRFLPLPQPLLLHPQPSLFLDPTSPLSPSTSDSYFSPSFSYFSIPFYSRLLPQVPQDPLVPGPEPGKKGKGLIPFPGSWFKDKKKKEEEVAKAQVSLLYFKSLGRIEICCGTTKSP